MTDFERALAVTLRSEGGYSNVPQDPGGMTMMGIIQREYDAYRRELGLPTRWVKLIDFTEVKDIYRRKYWDKVTQGRVWPLNAVMFDAAVNSGPANAEWMLARAKALHPDHAALTPESVRQAQLALDVIDVRRGFFRAIVARRPASGVFLRGWLQRCDQQYQMCTTRPVLGLLDQDADAMPQISNDDFTPRTDDLDASTLGE